MKVTTKLGGISCGMIILLLITGTTSYLGLSKLIEDNQWQFHTEEVLLELDSLLHFLSESSTWQKGYVISGDEGFLEPYHSAAKETLQALDKIDRLTVENPSQQQRLHDLRPQIMERLSRYDQAIESFKIKGGKLHWIRSGLAKPKRGCSRYAPE